AQFVWYARFIRVLRIIGSDLESRHRELVYALVEHNLNGGLSWTPSSPFDTAYFPLFTPPFSRTINENETTTISCGRGGEDEDPQAHNFLTRLQATSPRLYYLCIDAAWQRLDEDLIRPMCSFKHLVDLELICTISVSSFHELAALHTPPEISPSRPHLVRRCADTIRVSSSDPCCAAGSNLRAPAASANPPRRPHRPRPSLRAPLLKQAVFTSTLCDRAPGHHTTLCYGYTLEHVEIAPHEPAPPPTRPRGMPLATLLRPLMGLRNMARFALVCPKRLPLAADDDDDDFAALARAWPRLRTFWLTHAYWAASRAAVDSDGSEDTEEHEEMSTGDIPTPEVLRLFREHCPDLCELVLPYRDIHAGVPKLDLTTQAGPPHGLKRLEFGTKTAVADDKDEEARARELAMGKEVLPLAGELDVPDGKAEEWARYILELFPTLNPGKSTADCVFLPAASGWIQMLRRVRELRRSGKGSESESTSGGVVVELSGQ
ncbi:hypothetical protein V8D89_006718, partial [Ganoderma adspersum]